MDIQMSCLRGVLIITDILLLFIIMMISQINTKPPNT